MVGWVRGGSGSPIVDQGSHYLMFFLSAEITYRRDEASRKYFKAMASRREKVDISSSNGTTKGRLGGQSSGKSRETI